MTERATKQQRMDLAFAALLNDDDAAALTALTRIEQQGDARAIPHLLRAHIANASPAVQSRISALLNQVKAPDAMSTLMAAIADPTLRKARRIAIAAIWSAGLDAREHLEPIIALAIEGDDEECFECLTVIENQEVWPERTTRLGLARVRKALEASSSDYRRAMLNDIVMNLEHRLG
ncbi:MAG: hypothetical protein JNM49_08645 [Flavobacteriales bacterium]|nr:hypothetical protein [Flavobacteriales bacterium]